MLKMREGRYRVIWVINAVIKYLITGCNRVIQFHPPINFVKVQIEIFKRKRSTILSKLVFVRTRIIEHLDLIDSYGLGSRSS